MGRATRLMEQAKDRFKADCVAAARCLQRIGPLANRLITNIVHSNDGALLSILRQRYKSGSYYAERRVRLGPNHVHAFITRKDGTVEDCGISCNLLTNIGRDVFSNWIGGAIPNAQNNPATTVTGTAVTGTGSTWTASNLGTPQLGLAGFRIYMPVTNITTQPVYGNIVSNTTSVATIDQWWTSADGVGTTPANTNNFIIGAGGIASVRFMGMTTNSSAASASDTTLPSEQTTNGGGRALATYAHTYGAATHTLQKAFSITGTITAVHKMGLFVCLTSAGADPLIFETVLNQDATVGNGDTLTITDTITVSG